MNSKHTPGPWHIEKGSNTFCETWHVAHHSSVRAQTIADCGAIVNQVYAGSLDNYVGERVNENHEANARLIAAAPELLEACKAVLYEHDMGEHPLLVNRLSDLVRGAINKATNGIPSQSHATGGAK